MEVVLWAVTLVAAAIFGWDGVGKLLRPRQETESRGLGFVNDFPDVAVKAIGVLEVLGAVGLILPAITGVAQILVPIAAFGLAAMMAAALAVHIRRNDYSTLRVNLTLLAVALFIGVGRLGVAPFWS